MSIALYAFIDKEDDPRPPFQGSRIANELGFEFSQLKRFPWPRVVLLEERDSGIFLTRFGVRGEFAGDTWHETMEEGKDQAQYEFGDWLGEWKQVAADVDEPEQYISSLMSGKMGAS